LEIPWAIETMQKSESIGLDFGGCIPVPYRERWLMVIELIKN